MDSRYSRDELLKFLDFMAEKGLMKKTTASSRKAAANTLMSILEPSESSDVRNIDLDDLLMRFGNMKGAQFKPDSLSVYKSRLGSAINDFVRWRSNPAAFKPSTKDRAQKGNSHPNAGDERVGNKSGSDDRRNDPSAGNENVELITFPIPLRPGVIVRVTGIPSDLTPEEAEKIGNVILALSGSQEGE